jgi:NADH-quinone oxidoreductase subunit N
MNLNELSFNLSQILPLVFLVGWACALLLVDLFITLRRGSSHRWTPLLAALGLAIALGLSLLRPAEMTMVFGGMVLVDEFGRFLNVLFLVSGLLGVLLAVDYLPRMGWAHGEYYSLLLFSIAGMMLMAQAGDLIIVFLALELLSIPLYVLAAFGLPRAESEEAGLKYFLLGAFSTGFVVYGTALVYGATGSTGLAQIWNAAALGRAQPTLLLLGAGLIFTGFGFKVAAVPFHMWTPDVYQGAPTSVTAFMAVGAKAGGFAALLRIFMLAFPKLGVEMAPVILGVSALTMILGNVAAIWQSDLKRLLAYSSIAHAGYILMALAPFGQTGVIGRDALAAALFYLVSYAFTSFAAWAVVIAMERAEGRGLQLDDLAGMGRKYPLYAAAMAVAMLSFTGIPPTLGFVGKFYLFGAVLQAGYLGLALIGVLTSLISAYYYLRVVVVMYMRAGEPEVSRDPWLQGTAAAAALGTVVLSLFAMPLFAWVSRAAQQWFSQ